MAKSLLAAAVVCTLFLWAHAPLPAQDKPAKQDKPDKPAKQDKAQAKPDPAPSPADLAADEPSVFLKRTFQGAQISRPLFFTTLPGNPTRAYVLGQEGQIFTFLMADEIKTTTVALALGSKTRAGGEEGLLGLALHPDFAKNRKLYLQFTAGDTPRRNIVAEYTANADGTVIDAQSRRDILTIPQPYPNHNGGMLAFGPDNMLYISLGDGGAGSDPNNNGQRLDTLLGKILRIDVDNKDNDLQYAIPKDNPFATKPDAKPEIWAYGIRNAWRFSFDSKTGELWAGDVGQNAWEEISLITKGGNYGWRILEGNNDHRPKDPKPSVQLVPPVYEYPHHGPNKDFVGQCVTGGYVYRGKAIPALSGAYIFGDYASGKVWALRRIDGQPPKVWLIGKAPAISSFGQDADGEIYVVSMNGIILKIMPLPAK
jgi:glucose/arabinose dehydrogenase